MFGPPCHLSLSSQPCHLTPPTQPSQPCPRLKKRFVSRPLQRNQACATCRSRKVRCDAQRPACGACRRSAAAHGEDPDLVSCQYDEPSSQDTPSDPTLALPGDLTSSEPISKPPSSQLAILERKIAELENSIALLELDNQPPVVDLPSASLPPSRPDWPPSLPARLLTIQLVSIFNNQPLGAFGQAQFVDPAWLIHRLHLPSYHPLFPNLALIHVILLKTLQSNSRSYPRFDKPILDMFIHHHTNKYWPDSDRSPHDYHSRFFKSFFNQSLTSEIGLFEACQAINIYSYHALESGNLLEAWIFGGLASRSLGPLGLHELETCPEHLTGLKPKPRSLLGPPISNTEKCERASTFWLGFQIDRILSACSGQPHSISEEYISSLLPVQPGSIYSTLLPISSLSTHPLSISNPMILNCPFQSVSPSSGLTMSLSEELRCIELIATILLGRVTNWLRRSPDPVGFNLKKFWKSPGQRCIPDFRKTPGFIELDQSIQVFKMSLRPKLLDSIYVAEVDTNAAAIKEEEILDEQETTGSGMKYPRKISHEKLMTKLIISVSEILLNECFLNRKEHYQRATGGYGPTSMKIKTACDQMFEVGQEILDSGIDPRHLNPFTYFCWMVGIRNLIKFLVEDEIELNELNQEIKNLSSQALSRACGYRDSLSLKNEEDPMKEKIKQMKMMEECIKEQTNQIENMLKIFEMREAPSGSHFNLEDKYRDCIEEEEKWRFDDWFGITTSKAQHGRENAQMVTIEEGREVGTNESSSQSLGADVDHGNCETSMTLKEMYKLQLLKSLIHRFKTYKITDELI